MSLARALTVRLRRNADSSAPPSPLPTEQSSMMKRMASVIDRTKISSPVELISTTNMLSYNAPDVETIRQLRQASSSSSSVNSSSDSDSSSNNRSSTELTDASSVDASPCDPEPNHLSCYFQSAQDESTALPRSTSPARSKTPSIDAPAPAIPQRALSHSKSSHMALARQRSLRSVSSSASHHSAAPSRSSSVREQRSSTDMFKSSGGSSIDTTAHPFGRELEKLSEVVEELGGVMRDAELDDDACIMREFGLAKWSAEDYLSELQPLYGADFGAGNHPAATVPAWI